MTLWALMQATVAKVDPHLSNLVVGAAITIVVSLQGWMIRSMSQVRDEMKMIRQHLFGPTGNSGMSGELDDVQDDVENVKVRMGVHDVQIAQHETRLNIIDKK